MSTAGALPRTPLKELSSLRILRLGEVYDSAFCRLRPGGPAPGRRGVLGDELVLCYARYIRLPACRQTSPARGLGPRAGDNVSISMIQPQHGIPKGLWPFGGIQGQRPWLQGGFYFGVYALADIQEPVRVAGELGEGDGGYAGLKH